MIMELVAAATITQSGYSPFCQVLDQSPTVNTVEVIVLTGLQEGLSSESVAEILVSEVRRDCPSHIPLLEAFVEKWTQ